MIARENRPVVSDVVKISIRAADGNIEGRARGQTQDRREAQLTKIRGVSKVPEKTKRCRRSSRLRERSPEEVSGY